MTIHVHLHVHMYIYACAFAHVHLHKHTFTCTCAYDPCASAWQVRATAARAWSIWEGSTSKLLPDPDFISKYAGDSFADVFARIEVRTCRWAWVLSPASGSCSVSPRRAWKLENIAPGMIPQGTVMPPPPHPHTHPHAPSCALVAWACPVWLSIPVAPP